MGEELADRSGATIPALKNVIHEVRTAVMVAVTTASMTGAATGS